VLAITKASNGLRVFSTVRPIDALLHEHAALFELDRGASKPECHHYMSAWELPQGGHVKDQFAARNDAPQVFALQA
jgi:hypothetical protein